MINIAQYTQFCSYLHILDNVRCLKYVSLQSKHVATCTIDKNKQLCLTEIYIFFSTTCVICCFTYTFAYVIVDCVSMTILIESVAVCVMM
jgi:hypothetical protein